VPDRATIARIVERVFAQRGIPGGRSLSSDKQKGPPEPASAPEALPPAPQVKVAAFVSEDDVRSAIERREKIFIGPKTIVTPSARDLAGFYEVFVETEEAPAPRPPISAAAARPTRLDY
jgi:hypothetical protein